MRDVRGLLLLMFRLMLVSMITVVQLACAPMQSVQKQPAGVPNTVPQPESAVSVKPLSPSPSVTIQSNASRAPIRQQPAPVGTEQTAAPSPAVLALMTEAEHNRTQGNLDTAAATLERALRIQPRNAALWYELASVRLQQHQPRLAEDLAKKSNTLAYRDQALKNKNWQLIARSRRLQGDEEGAQEAEDKARAF